MRALLRVALALGAAAVVSSYTAAPPRTAEHRKLSSAADALAGTPAHTPAAAGDHGAADSHDSAASGEHGGEHEGHQHDAIFYLFNAIVLGTAVVHVTTYVPSLAGVQPTVATFVLGMMYAGVIEGLDLHATSGVIGRSYDMWMSIDPHLLLFTLLPVLLTGDAMNIDTSVARSVAKQCLWLAGPGTLVNAFLMAVCLWAYLPYDWPFMLCMTIGSILGATDPVAVVSLLKELGASPILTVQIQGESLLNDGVAIVLFSVSYDMYKGAHMSAKDMFLYMVKVALCAWFLGAFIGGLFASWIRKASNRLHHSSVLIQIVLTLTCAYVSWFLAEGVLKISGVLSTVAAALVLADNMWSSVVSKESLNEVWHMLEYFGNTVLFFLAGSLISKSMFLIPFQDYLHLVYIYIMATIIRAIVIFGSRPLLKTLSSERRSVSAADAAVMTWGGLRGAVGLSLAIVVSSDKDMAEDPMTAARVLFYVGGVATLTLLVNATTCPTLVNKLGITQTSTTKKHILLNHVNRLQDLMMYEQPTPAAQAILEEKLQGIVEDIFPNGIPKVHRKLVSKNTLREETGHVNPAEELLTCGVPGTALVELQQTSETILAPVLEHVPLLGALPEKVVLKNEDGLLKMVAETMPDAGLQKALNETMLSLVRHQYWQMIEAGHFSPGANTADRLLNSIPKALQTPELINDLSFVEHDMHLKELMTKKMDMSVRESKQDSHSFQKLKALFSPAEQRDDSVTRTQSGASDQSVSLCKVIVKSQAFFIFMIAVIILNTVLILLEDDSTMATSVPWLVSDCLFTGLFIFEFLIKIYVMGIAYFYDGWNTTDFMCVVLAVTGLAFRVLMFAGAMKDNIAGSEADVLRLNRLFRIMRLMRVTELIRIFRVSRAHHRGQRVSQQLAECLDTIESMKAFAVAHMLSQKAFVRYFGDRGQLSGPEEIRTLIDSRISVNLALARAAETASRLSKEALIGLNVLWESKQVIEELSAFVLSALNAGIINHQEAEQLIEPLKHHSQHAMNVFGDSHLGILDDSLVQYYEMVEEEKKDAAQREAMRKVEISLAMEAGSTRLRQSSVRSEADSERKVQQEIHVANIMDSIQVGDRRLSSGGGFTRATSAGSLVCERVHMRALEANAGEEEASYTRSRQWSGMSDLILEEEEEEHSETGAALLNLQKMISAAKVVNLNASERDRLKLETQMILKYLGAAKGNVGQTDRGVEKIMVEVETEGYHERWLEENAELCKV